MSLNKTNNQSYRFYTLSSREESSHGSSTCDQCGTKVTTPFCTQCGKKVGGSSDEYSLCGQCGTTVTTPFCTKCGGKRIQPSQSIAAPYETNPGHLRVNSSDDRNLAIQAKKQEPSVITRSFKSLVERSIAAWNSLAYARDPDIQIAVSRLSSLLRSFNSVDDLFRSRTMFWFFHRRESFMKQSRFIKWDISHLDDYVLLPAEEGFVNKRDCFYVSHFWRTREAPDPQGEDFKLVHQDLANQQWTYVWVDWTCLPQNAGTQVEREYTNRMLMRTPVLMRECAFEWRYPEFQPRLWILLEVSQYMLNSSGNFAKTADMQPYIDDVHAMKSEGVYQTIKQRGYSCSMSRDYRLLVGWLELLIIMSKIVPEIPMRKFILDSLEPASVGGLKHMDTGINVDKTNGIVSHDGAVNRFDPLFPLDEDGFPKGVS